MPYLVTVIEWEEFISSADLLAVVSSFLSIVPIVRNRFNGFSSRLEVFQARGTLIGVQDAGRSVD